MRLCSKFACEINFVKTSSLAIEGYIATRLMGNTTKAPEEIKVPECAIKFSICDEGIA